MITVIIPIYNKEKYLVRLESCLQRQTYKDFEVIFVDDCSTDGSSELLDKLAEDNDSYVVVHKANGGVSSARNEGIRRARGEWLTFIDADDTVTDDYLETLLNYASDQVDLVIGGQARVDENDRLVDPLFPEDQGFIHVSEAITWLFKPKYFWGGSVWGKLYRREIVVTNRLFFDESKRYGEDILFSLQYLTRICKGVFNMTKPIYHYNVDNQQSITHNISVENCIIELDSYTRICKIVMSAHTGSIECVMRACMDTYKKYRCLLRQIEEKHEHVEELGNIRDMVKTTLGIHRVYCWLLWHLKFKKKYLS